MRELLSQVGGALEAELYYLALMGALAIPDICGAMESADGEAKGDRYKSWFERYVTNGDLGPLKTCLSAEECWVLRCSMLHQGRVQHPKSAYTRYVIAEPTPGMNVTDGNSMSLICGSDQVTAFQIDLRLLCSNLIAAAETWLAANESTDVYRANYERFVKRRPDGEFQMGPVRFAFVKGWPVIT